MAESFHLALVGGFGFVGCNLLDQIRQGHGGKEFQPCVIDNLLNAAANHPGFDCPALHRSYLDPSVAGFLDTVGAGRRLFVFLAGETRVAESRERPLDFIEANIAAPARFMVDHLRPGDGFILVSTAGALFDGSGVISTRSAYSPKNFYGATKAAEELCLARLADIRGAAFSIVRLTNVYGAFSDRKKSAIHRFARACLQGDKVLVNGSGTQTRDFVFAADVADGLLALAEMFAGDGPLPEVSIIGSGRSASLLDVIEEVEAACGRPLHREHVPATELLATEPEHVIVDPADATALLPGEATPLGEGISRTVDFYRTAAVA